MGFRSGSGGGVSWDASVYCLRGDEGVGSPGVLCWSGDAGWLSGNEVLGTSR